jgi:hypothetical protein
MLSFFLIWQNCQLQEWRVTNLEQDNLATHLSACAPTPASLWSGQGEHLEFLVNCNVPVNLEIGVELLLEFREEKHLRSLTRLRLEQVLPQ